MGSRGGFEPGGGHLCWTLARLRSGSVAGRPCSPGRNLPCRVVFCQLHGMWFSSELHLSRVVCTRCSCDLLSAGSYGSEDLTEMVPKETRRTSFSSEGGPSHQEDGFAGAWAGPLDSPPLTCGLHGVLRKQGPELIVLWALRPTGHTAWQAGVPTPIVEMATLRPILREGRKPCGKRRQQWVASCPSVRLPQPGKGASRMRLRGSGQGRAGGPQDPREPGEENACLLQRKGCSGSLSSGSRRERVVAPADAKWVPCSWDALGLSSSS